MNALTAALIAVQQNADRLRGKPGKTGDRGASGAPGERGLPGKPGLIWRGTWKRSTAYLKGDAVEVDGSSYVATDAVQGTKPPHGSWDLVALKGTDGQPGAPGHAGMAGVPIEDEGIAKGVAGSFNFVGSGVSAAMNPRGGVDVTVSSGGGGSALEVLDEGSSLDTAVTSVNFTGTGVVATNVGHAVTVTVADDQTAAEVPFTPAGTIAATNVQAAIEEVAAEASGGSGIDVTNTIYLESNNAVPDANRAAWDAIYDREQNDITGSGIPAGMGLSLSTTIDPNDGVQFDEEGVWYFELIANPAQDDTAQVDFQMHADDYPGGTREKVLSVAVQPQIGLASVVNMPASQVPSIVWVIASTFGATPTDPSYAPWEYGVLKIVRLA